VLFLAAEIIRFEPDQGNTCERELCFLQSNFLYSDTMYFTSSLIAMLCAFVTQGGYADGSAAPQCKRFDQIYKNGKELCENMWDGSFVYETDESKSYTMWFFDKVNPNDATARTLGKLGAGPHDTCHLDNFHKDAPGPEPDNFTACFPYKNDACCEEKKVSSRDVMNEGYGKEWHWDRCGPMSLECDQFFVQEQCFYECDPNLGLYRKFHSSALPLRPGTELHNASNENHNVWQIHAMPIKASYCDAWWQACRKDKFYADDGGSYFSAGAVWEKFDEVAELQAELEKAKKAQEEDDEMDVGIIGAFAGAGVVICGLLAFACCLVKREKSGKPMFGTLLDGSKATEGQTVGKGSS